MAIPGDLRLSSPVGPYPANPLTRCSFPPPKVDFGFFHNAGTGVSVVTPKWSRPVVDGNNLRCHSKRSLAMFGEYGQDLDLFLNNAINMNFLQRLNLAWRIIFPSAATRRKSNANIAKQRLKMILFSDRCAVSDEAKQKIVRNVVNALSDFVEIESQDKVQLSVSTDPDLGTIYSVTVPVRRVKPEYQEDDPTGTITNIEYKDNGESSGSVDVKFDFYIPNKSFNDFGLGN